MPQVYTLFTATQMPPGVTWDFEWKNIPQGTAYAVDAEPFYTGSYQEGYGSVTEVEVTRFWRRRRAIQRPGSIGVTVDVHNDIRCQVKNVGGHTLDFTLYLIVFP